MFQVVECAACGFTDLGWVECCPDCGGALTGTVPEEGEDPLFALNLVDSGEVTYQAHLQHTVAYQQLREICEAAHADQLSDESLQFLLAELEVYLQRQILTFQGQDPSRGARSVPNAERRTAQRSVAIDLIVEGLWALCEACDLASQVAEQGKSVLVLAERVAAEGDVWVGQGRQSLTRLAA